jgi:hypothetical protein
VLGDGFGTKKKQKKTTDLSSILGMSGSGGSYRAHFFDKANDNPATGHAGLRQNPSLA